MSATVIGIDPAANRLAFAGWAQDRFFVRKCNLGSPYTNQHSYRAYEQTSALLSDLPLRAKGIPAPIRYAFVEAPVVAGARNIQSTIKQAVVSGGLQVALLEWGFVIYLVPPTVWKKEIGAGGNASKDRITTHLHAIRPKLAGLCADDQDVLDALGIALYGAAIVRRGNGLAVPGTVSRRRKPVLRRSRLYS